MSISAIAAFAPSGIPQRFTVFAKRTGVTLTPAQRVLALVAFDGLEPGQLIGADREIGRQLFGDVDVIPAGARHVLVAVCGARAGKSYVFGALRLLHLALTVPLTTLAPGEMAVGLIVAPDIRLAKQVLRYVVGAVELSQAIKHCIVSQTADGVVLRRQDGRTVSIECLPATRGGSAVRGRSLVGVVLDECAFFRDDSYQVNDAEVFRAVAPRVLRGGQVVIDSTPWAEAGLLFDFHRRNHGHPVDAISAHAPTLLLRNDEHTRGYVEREHARDSMNARREFGAEFMPLTTETFFSPRAIDDAVDNAIILPAPRIYGAVQGWGGDFAFRSDSSALVGVQRTLEHYITGQIVEVRPDGGPLKPSAVVQFFAGEMKPSGSDTMMADSHYRQSIVEHLEQHELYLAPAPEGQMGKAETYQRARTLLHEGACKIPNHERFISQLKAVMWRPQPGGGVSIVSPRSKTGGHGDIVSAWVLAMWQCSLGIPESSTVPAKPGTNAYEEYREEQRMQKLAEEYVRETSDEADYYAQDNGWIRGAG